MSIVESAGLTDIGKKRKENQDALFMDDLMGLYVVSDGMGGHRAGEVASRMVVEGMRDVVAGKKKPSPDDGNSSPGLSENANLLLAAIQVANREVYAAASGNASYQGMGATVSAVLFTAESLVAANVGDSPIYLIHSGKMESLYVPHTLVAEHAAIDPEGVMPLNPNFKHVLTRAVGTHDSVLPDSCEIQWFPGDMVVICSDGLSNLVTTEEICRFVQRETPVSACRRLVDLANERGGDDNITVVVVKRGPVRSRIRQIVKWVTGLFWRE